MKKMYKQPIVEQTQMMPCSMVMSGSGDAISNGGNTSSDPFQGGDPVGD